MLKSEIQEAIAQLQELHVEEIHCQACKKSDHLTVLEFTAPGHGPYTWFRLPAGWWTLEFDSSYRCGDCLKHRGERIPMPGQKPKEGEKRAKKRGK